MHNLLHLLNRFNIQLLENLQNLGTFEIHVETPIYPFSKILFETLFTPTEKYKRKPVLLSARIT